MKVVITTLKLDFSLPRKQILRFFELKGIPIGLYTHPNMWLKANPNKMIQWKPEDDPKGHSFIYYMYGEQKRFLLNMCEHKRFDTTFRDYERTDHALIQTVEELQASYSGDWREKWKLENWHVIDLPDGVEWEIKHPYSGSYKTGEWIEEKHRIWR